VAERAGAHAAAVIRVTPWHPVSSGQPRSRFANEPNPPPATTKRAWARSSGVDGSVTARVVR
jgi:hypothetical protein